MSLHVQLRIDEAWLAESDEFTQRTVPVSVHVGEDESNSQLHMVGIMWLTMGQAQLLGAALSLGAERTLGHLTVTHTGYLSENL